MGEQQKTEPEQVQEPDRELDVESLYESIAVCESAGYIVTTSSDLLKVWGIGLLLTVILGLAIGFSIFSVYTCS
jgi:hypothetical protein